ncbi:MAG: hypothetical protein OER86_09180 [Phycisphaerae bacterium]|nr:hypothetical protein [Phycisphaerae bacterium]
MNYPTLVAIALFSVAGCAATPQAPAPRPDSWAVVDAAIAAWLRDSPNLTRSEPRLRRTEILSLRKTGLPSGYVPNVPTQKLFITDLPQHQGPSAGKAIEEDGVDSSSPHIIQIDSIRITGDTAVVEISDNRHHSLGASGGTYHLRRTVGGWFVLPLSKIWTSDASRSGPPAHGDELPARIGRDRTGRRIQT